MYSEVMVCRFLSGTEGMWTSPSSPSKVCYKRRVWWKVCAANVCGSASIFDTEDDKLRNAGG